MIASVSLNDVLRDEQQNEKIINFSSAILRSVSNIPNVVITIIAIPFLLLMIPILNWVLASLIRKTSAMVANINRDIQQMDYESVKQIYDLLSGLRHDTDFLNSESTFLTRGLKAKLVKLLELYKTIKEALEAVLFVDMSGQPPLTKEEKLAFEALNDIWGDDEDGEYAKMTFNQLKKR